MLAKWVLSDVDKAIIDRLHNATGFAPFVCEVLAGRGYDTSEKIAHLVAPGGPQELQNPMSFLGMDKAVERILGAVWFDQKICVYGDYDCDGVTATALLVSCLRSIDAEVTFYIPNRFDEGYGINKDAIRKLHSSGIELIVTVDNGISAADEVDYALELGLDIVITDHHSIPNGSLPRVPTVNPHLPDCPSVYKDIAGVGVAFYLSCALMQKQPEELLEVYGDLVALGSIADVMPLTGDNRIFAQKGVQMLESGAHRPGIQALMEVADIGKKSLSARTFAFSLGPRVNAAGRMDDASAAVSMMLTDDYPAALTAATRLNTLNTERKQIEDDIMKEIEETFITFPDILLRRVIVVSGEGWHQGVIGIVAARLVERYGKPSIVFTASDGIAHGSGRSIPEISLIEAVSAVGKHLERFGGHKQAAGMTIKAENLDAFAVEIDNYCMIKHPVMPAPGIGIDAAVTIGDLSIPNVKALSVLEPFGEGNPVPKFVLSGVSVVDVASLSHGKHSKIFFKKGNDTFQALYFQMAPESFPYCEHDVVDVLVQLEVGEYRGEDQLSAFVRGIKPHRFIAEDLLAEFEAYNRHLRGFYDNSFEKQSMLPSREEIASVFRFIKQRGMIPTSAEFAYAMLDSLSYQKTLVIFDIMVEMGFIQSHSGNYVLADISTRRSLDDSTILKALQTKGIQCEKDC